MLRAFAACKFKDFTIRKVRRHPRVCVHGQALRCARQETRTPAHTRTCADRALHVASMQCVRMVVFVML